MEKCGFVENEFGLLSSLMFFCFNRPPFLRAEMLVFTSFTDFKLANYILTIA